MSAGLPGFTAAAALGRGGAYRSPAGAGPAATGPAMVAALAMKSKWYGCACGMKECCCRVYAPGGDVVACCPRDGDGPCYSWVERLRAAPVGGLTAAA